MVATWCNVLVPVDDALEQSLTTARIQIEIPRHR